MKYAVYKTASGEITSWRDTPLDWIGQGVLPNESFIQVDDFEDSNLVYIVDEDIVPRPDMPIAITKTEIEADGIDSSVITGIPVGAELVIHGPINHVETVNDGQAEVSTNLAGSYKVLIQHFPHKDWEQTIVAD